MSGKPSQPTPAKAQSSSRSPQDARVTITRLKPTIERFPSGLPEEPYILAVPSDRPYNLSSQHRDNWRIDGFFEPREEHLQYQTFLWRDSATSLFELKAPHEDEMRRKEEAVKVAGGLKSGSGTPLQNLAAKKKISLSDYKKAKSSGQGGTPALQVKSHLSEIIHNPKNDAIQEPFCTPETINQKASAVKSNPVAKPEVVTLDKSELTKAKPVEVLPTVHPEQETKPSFDSEIFGTAGADKSTDLLRATAISAQGLKRPLETAITDKGPPSASVTTSPRPPKKSRLASPSHDGIGKEAVIVPQPLPEPPELLVNGIPQDKIGFSPIKGSVKGQTLYSEPMTAYVELITKFSAVNPSEYQHSTAVDKGIPGWLPGASPWQTEDELPPRLPDLPIWLDASSSRSIDDISNSPRLASSPDTLKSSAAYSQTSSSSLSLGKLEVFGATPTRISAHPVSQALEDTKQTSVARADPKGKVRIKGVEDISDRQKNARKTIKIDPGVRSLPEKKQNLGQPENQTSVPALQASGTESSKEKLILRLKYGRSRMRDIQRILQLKPMPRRDFGIPKSAVPPSNVCESSREIKRAFELAQGNSQPKRPQESGGDNTVEAAEGRSLMKRPRENGIEHSAEPPPKRRKRDDQDVPQTPRTPNTHSAQSPITSLSTASLHRLVLTPKKDIKLGTSSNKPTPHIQAITPQSKSDTPHASSAGEHAARSSRPLSQNGKGGAESRAWDAEHEKQMELAKELRRSVKATLESKNEVDAEEANVNIRRAAIEGIESVLCFMLAFLALGQAMRTTKVLIRAWDTLIPWAGEVRRNCQDFPHLEGLSLLLRSTSCSYLASLYTRLGPGELTTSTSESELAKVLGNIRIMQQSAAEAERLLSHSTLVAQYPATQFECQQLPLGVMTKPIVAVRMSCRFLGEWTKNEDVNWKQRLEEGLCSQIQ